jgi:hypothetical protein
MKPDQGELFEDDDGQDDATEEQSEALDLSSEERRLVTQPYDLGVKGLTTDIEQGRITLEIAYQRKYVWDAGKASRLIESLLLNVPIPVCYFAEDENGVYEVIDGLQRLQSIKNFLEGKLQLRGLSVLKELDGKSFTELAPKDRRRLENRTIRCIVITEDSHPDIKFDVFERLNTGAASLTAQELRNSVYRGPLNDSLKALSSASYFVAIVGESKNPRMDFEEMILRFFALVDGLEAYRPPIRQFLNSYMRKNRQITPNDESISVLRSTCEVVHDVFGGSAFRVGESRNLNKAMFDAIMVASANSSHSDLRDKKSEVVAAVEALQGDEDFRAAIGRATADRTRMLYRVGAVAQSFRQLGIAVSLPLGLGIPSSSSGGGSSG